MAGFWHRLNDKTTPLGKTFRTFYQAFIALFLFTLAGFLGDVVQWAQCVDDCKSFPQITVLGKAAISALASAAVATVTFIQNGLVENKK